MTLKGITPRGGERKAVLDAYLEQMNEEDRAIALEWLLARREEDPRLFYYPSEAVADALKRGGYPVSETTVRRYRRIIKAQEARASGA